MASGVWQQGIAIPASETQRKRWKSRKVDGKIVGAVPGLTEGADYVFRVTAKNKNGLSNPSPQSDSVLTAPTTATSNCSITLCE